VIHRPNLIGFDSMGVNRSIYRPRSARFIDRIDRFRFAGIDRSDATAAIRRNPSSTSTEVR